MTQNTDKLAAFMNKFVTEARDQGLEFFTFLCDPQNMTSTHQMLVHGGSEFERILKTLLGVMDHLTTAEGAALIDMSADCVERSMYVNGVKTPEE